MRRLRQTWRSLKRVVVLMSLDSTRGQDIMRGVLRYNQPIWRWDLRSQLADIKYVAEAEAWKADGIIAHAYNTAIIHRLQSLGVPVVSISSRIAHQPFPQVIHDNVAVGRMGAEYFLAKGYRNFAVLTDQTSNASVQRLRGFLDRLAQADRSPPVYDLRDQDGVFTHWERASKPLEKWLRSLPKPVAIFADDYRGPVASQICGRIGIAVPEQTAILGVDNNELQCRQARPPLSSIVVPHEEFGYQAAQLLDSLMRGGKPPETPILIQPTGVVTRESTDILAVEDVEVAAAMHFINRNAHHRITAREVVDELTIGRRVLETRFRKATGRTLLEDIHRVCVEHAKLILGTTDKPLPAVARDAGFRDAQHLWAVFKKMVGIPPAAYRKRQRD